MSLYGTLSEVEYSPALGAFDEPLSLEAIKEYLNLPILSPPDTAKDAELEGFRDAAIEIAEEEWGGDIRLKQYLLVCDDWACEEFGLRFPLVSVDLIRYRNEDGDWTNLAEGTGYVVDSRKKPGTVMLPTDGSWPTSTLWPSGSIEVYFSSGYSDGSLIPKKLKQGIMMLTSDWYTKRVPEGDIPPVVYRLLRGAPRV